MSVDIVVPEVGESVTEARVARWLKQAGDRVDAGEAVVELETDKVDLEVAAPAAGVLNVLHADGDDVKVGDVLGRVEASAAAAAAPAQAAPARPATPTTAPAATPTARKLARERGVPLTSVKPSGPRITPADVDAASQAKPKEEKPAPAPRPVPAPAPVAARTDDAPRETRQRMSRRRATIARRLLEAQQTAALLTTFNEIDMSAVAAIRRKQREAKDREKGTPIGITSFFVKAVIVALKQHPRLNAEIQDDEMVIKHHYDIGVAIGAAEGLIVPVLRDADRLTFAGIEERIRDFAARSADGTIALDDLRGGTFSITNGGVYGSLMSTPIVNPPQVAILGLHTIKERPIGVGGAIELRPMMYVALTYDHRIVDGEDAVRFLVRVKELIEDPGALLIAT